MSEIIKVGMADLGIAKPPDGLITMGLGSCVAVALRDPVTKVGGLIHVMLPDSTAIRGTHTNPAKFADTGIALLIKKMEDAGARKTRLVAKLAGGATMFATTSKCDWSMIGDRNVEACKKALATYRIPVLSESTGANYGRTVTFYPETGEYHIKAVGKEIQII
ncbi:MAG: chemotaxis protein CheD [Lachnospiraceae bacterium]|nr:chemotaxis protein CheD [Lachnospiraceae bacterium]